MKEKGYFYLILGAIVFLIVVYFVGKSYGKNKPPREIPLPDDDPSGTGSDFDPTSLTDKLYNDIQGWSNPLNRDMNAWNAFLSLSDTNFVKVLNDWNERYYSKWKETLYQSYLKEKFNPWTSKNLLVSLNEKFARLDKSKKQ